MDKGIISKKHLTGIADAIRQRDEETRKYKPSEMADEASRFALEYEQAYQTSELILKGGNIVANKQEVIKGVLQAPVGVIIPDTIKGETLSDLGGWGSLEYRDEDGILRYLYDDDVIPFSMYEMLTKIFPYNALVIRRNLVTWNNTISVNAELIFTDTPMEVSYKVYDNGDSAINFDGRGIGNAYFSLKDWESGYNTTVLKPDFLIDDFRIGDINRSMGNSGTGLHIFKDTNTDLIVYGNVEINYL